MRNVVPKNNIQSGARRSIQKEETRKIILESARILLPIGGIQSTHDIKTLVGQIKAMKRHLKTMGCDLDDPLFTIHFLCMAGLPFIRILPTGIMDIVNQGILFPR